MTANPFAESEPLHAPAAPAPAPAAQEPFWARRRTTLALVAILIVAALFRFYGRDFDQDTHQHPDERFIVDQTLGLSWPQTTSQFFEDVLTKKALVSLYSFDNHEGKTTVTCDQTVAHKL